MEEENIVLLRKEWRLGIYIHVCSRQICSFQTTVRQIRICEVCLPQVSHFEVDEAQVKFGKVSWVQIDSLGKGEDENKHLIHEAPLYAYYYQNNDL